MARIKLIDVDSTIPNLALMKISAFHKSIGNEVVLEKYPTHIDEYMGLTGPDDTTDKAYASIIFRKNKAYSDIIQEMHRCKVYFGGPGYSLHSDLPEEIEMMKPDYYLYHEIAYSIGFTTRGCNRSCKFCIVPQKEGKFEVIQHPEDWYDPKFRKIMFLDNNILFDTAWFMEVTDWCMEHKLQVWFSSGLDIRLLTPEVARRLLELDLWKPIFFAWDDIEIEMTVLDKIDMLMDNGFTESKMRRHLSFYVYTDSDDEYDSAVYRCRALKSMQCNSFVMFDIDKKPTPRIQKLRRWANTPSIYWKVDIDEYTRAKDAPKKKKAVDVDVQQECSTEAC